MKKLLFLFLFINLFLLNTIAIELTKSPAPVFITAGQSNTDGRVRCDLLPYYIQQNKYDHCYWCYGSFGELQTDGFEPFWPKSARKDIHDSWAYDAVTYYWLDKALNEDFYVIKMSLGGTAIDTCSESNGNMYWNADPEWLSHNNSTFKGGKSLLLSFTEEIAQCIDNHLSLLPQGYEIKAFLWHQGEGDCNAGDRYHDNLKKLVGYVRDYLVNKTGNQDYAHLPFVFGTVAQNNLQYSQEVDAAMRSLAEEDANFHIVDMSKAQLQSDELHFTAPWAEHLGIEMYNILVELGLAGNNASIIQDMNK